MGLDNPIHIAFLVVILLLVFGARRLPEIGRSLGSGMREFKDSISGETKQPSLNATVQQPQPVAQPAETQPDLPVDSGSTEGRPSSSSGEPQRQQ
jgi:sec-independent protein translocase protein TatA